MLSQTEHAKFTMSINKMLKDCLVEKDDYNGDGFVRKGNSSYTQDNVYFYNSNAKNHREELLELCKKLPKLETVLIGTAGTIAFSDLISDTKFPSVLKKQMVTADHFINLAFFNGLVIPEKVTFENGTFATHLNLHHSLEKLLQETPGQEPADD